MNRKYYFVLFVLVLLLQQKYSVAAQDFYRFKADYTIKLTRKGNKPVMKKGTVFYDKNVKKIVIKNGFPVKEDIIHSDTSIYFVRVGRIINRTTNFLPVEFSVFHLALNGNLANYGLDKAGYILNEVSRDKGLVIATWLPENSFKENLGKIIIATKGKELYSIVFLNKQEEIVSKHIFHKYMYDKGFSFPTEIVRIYYDNGEELYELTTYRNIKINETGNDEYYNYRIPE